GTFQRLSDQTGRWLLLLIFLPHDAAVAVDAIVRTLVRVFLTRRRLLQWTSAARTAEDLAAGDTRRFIWREVDARILLRRIARRTWRYFEVFAGPDDQWLPPDNFQEQPRGEVAHRTS